jgi:hypothetical protein
MSWGEAELTVFSKAEDAHSEGVANALGIPLKILDSPSTNEVETCLEQFSINARVCRE